MDTMRDWTMQIAGVIILSTICDIIVADGEIKKYIKPIFGFLLIAAFIRPVAGVHWDKIRLDIPEQSSPLRSRLEESFSESQIESVLALYTNKIEDKVEKVLGERFAGEFKVCATVNDGETEFGKIEKIDIQTESAENIDDNSIREVVSREFGAKNEDITVRMR